MNEITEVIENSEQAACAVCYNSDTEPYHVVVLKRELKSLRRAYDMSIRAIDSYQKGLVQEQNKSEEYGRKSNEVYLVLKGLGYDIIDDEKNPE